MHTSIRWNAETLKEFVEKRIAITSGIKSGSFETLWRQIFPETIYNTYYKLEESSFDYILRHTMLRPRQLQIHLSHLASRYRGLPIDPSMVPKSVADSSRMLAKYFIDEYNLDHPNLERFILMFEQKGNVMEFKNFRDIVAAALKRYNGVEHGVDVDEKIDVLYTMGFFGVIRFQESGDYLQDQNYYPPTRESRRHHVDFFFRKAFTKVSSRLDDQSLVAIHPMFSEYANLKMHGSLIIG